MVWQEDSAGKVSGNTAQQVNEPDSQPASELLHVSHHEHLEEDGYQERYQPGKQRNCNTSETTMCQKVSVKPLTGSGAKYMKSFIVFDKVPRFRITHQEID